MYSNPTQKMLPNTSSDHCPISYEAATSFKRSKTFRFEICWLRMPGFIEFVEEEWRASPTANSPLQLHEKLNQLQKAIKSWTSAMVGNITVQLRVCRDFIEWVDMVQERRQITQLEKFIKALIKKRHTELAIMEDDMWHQRAKIQWVCKVI